VRGEHTHRHTHREYGLLISQFIPEKENRLKQVTWEASIILCTIPNSIPTRDNGKLFEDIK
jgi:hypothetical protein